MILHEVEQNTEAWDDLRSGKLTASIAKKLVTPTGKRSTQYKGEIARIIAERMGLQEPEEIKPTWWMQRGTNLEHEARAWFEVETDLTVRTDIGFIESDDHLVGASPDGIIMTDTCRPYTPLELKVPKPSTHISWYLDGVVPKEHIGQVHYQIALCEAAHGYFCSYNPNTPPLILRVDRGPYTETMEKAIEEYKQEYQAALLKMTGETL